MFEELKGTIERGERYILVEHGKPAFVLMPFADYRELRQSSGENRPGPMPAVSRDLFRANAELEEVRARAADLGVPEYIPEVKNSDPSSIHLEDLPL